ncbi:MAG: phenylacetate--CoA ligase family protein [Ruminococcaceae bacterium]|nr:phenylacetate--CoA ligase family protein [Oscillospiraceae bacterium]
MKNIRYYVYWFLDLIKGGKVKKNFDEIQQLLQNDDIKQWQDKKIQQLLTFASEHCSFYKNYDQYSDFSQIPIIDKSVVKTNYEDLFAKCYDKKTLHVMSTSGSTGTPFAIYQNPEKRNRVLAELIYFNSIIGQNIGDKFIFYRVWTDKNRKSKLEQIKQNLMPIDILRLDEANLQYIIDVLLKDKKIKSTLAYASTYDMILHYLNDKQIRGNFHLKAMVSSSEVLTDETRDGLESMIGCKVINRYSNQECGVIAQSNLASNSMQINSASYYVEVLRTGSDEPVTKGEVGRIVVTDLFNYAMPLIRYDTGDLGILSEDGKGFETISGRRVDLIYDTSGRPLTPHTWSVYMWKYDRLKQYQFIQNEKNDYLLKVNGADGIYTEEDFKATLKGVLGEDANITVEYVDEIPVLASGKFKKTICNYDPKV